MTTYSNKTISLFNEVEYIQKNIDIISPMNPSDVLLDSDCLTKDEMCIKYKARLDYFYSELLNSINNDQAQ